MEEAYLQILKASDSGTGFSFNTYLGTDYNPPQNLGRPALPAFFSPSAAPQVVHVSTHERNLFTCLSPKLLCLVANRTHVYVFNETVLNWLPPPVPGLSADGADRKLSQSSSERGIFASCKSCCQITISLRLSAEMLTLAALRGFRTHSMETPKTKKVAWKNHRFER